MQLKKINPNLQKALIEAGLTEANEMQAETFSTIKSGADAVIQSGSGSGKTTAIALHIVQKLAKAEGESTRALLFVEDRDKVVETVKLIQELAQHTDLRVYGVHEKGDVDYDKNMISLGLDILVGTPVKLNSLFSTAGFNLNTVKFFVVDDADRIFRIRQDAAVIRLSDSLEKTQRLFFCTEITEKVEIMADRIMVEPLFFEMDGEEDGEE